MFINNQSDVSIISLTKIPVIAISDSFLIINTFVSKLGSPVFNLMVLPKLNDILRYILYLLN